LWYLDLARSGAGYRVAVEAELLGQQDSDGRGWKVVITPKALFLLRSSRWARSGNLESFCPSGWLSGGANVRSADGADLVGQVVHVARLDAEGDSWISVHLSEADALEKLHAVAEAWGFGDLLEPSERLAWSVTSLPMMSSEESAEYPETQVLVQVPSDPGGELLSTFKMLVMKDIVGGVSAQELAGDLDISADDAARRLEELVSS